MTQPHLQGVNIGGVRLTAGLVEAAMTVRGSSPDALKIIADAIQNQADAAAQSLVHTAPDQFLAAQGRAQVLVALAMLLAQPETHFAQLRRK